MALNNSGPISIGGSTSGQSINLELGRSATAQSSLNESALRTLAGVASGQISLSNFYGKSNGVQYLGVWRQLSTSPITSLNINSVDVFGASLPTLQQNDLLLVLLSSVDYAGGNISNTVDSIGYNQIGRLFASAPTVAPRAVNIQQYYKLMGATPDTTINTTYRANGINRQYLATVIAFRNVNTVSPLWDSATATGTGNLNLDGASVTTSRNNSMCVTLGTYGASGGTTFSPPTTNVVASSFGGSNGSSPVAYGSNTYTVHLLATPGAFDVGAWSPGADSNGAWAAISVSVNAA